MSLSFSHDDPKQKTSFNIPLFAMVSREVLALVSLVLLLPLLLLLLVLPLFERKGKGKGRWV